MILKIKQLIHLISVDNLFWISKNCSLEHFTCEDDNKTTKDVLKVMPWTVCHCGPYQPVDLTIESTEFKTSRIFTPMYLNHCNLAKVVKLAQHFILYDMRILKILIARPSDILFMSY